MEATSPPSDNSRPKKRCHVPTKRAAKADALAPDVSIPLRFIVAGLLSLPAGVAMLATRPDILATYHYNQYVISVTHLVVLGWILSVVFGAMYQIVAVGLETPLHSRLLARAHFSLHVIGVAGMVWGFWRWDLKLAGIFGSVLTLGVALFSYNMGRTLARAPRWSPTAAFFASAVAWLGMTVLAGLFIVVDKRWGLSWFGPLAQMHAHAHLGVLGVFLMAIVGGSYQLMPMFCISELQSVRRAWWSFGLLNIGVAGSCVGILFERPVKLIFAVVVMGGLTVYLREMIAVLRARKRGKLDWGLVSFLTAIGMLVPLFAASLALSWPGLPANRFMALLENVYGFVGLFGVVSLATMGMLYKIAPFLVWYSSYSKRIGQGKVPGLSDLYSTRLQAVSYWAHLAAIAVISAAILSGNENAVRFGCGLLGASVLAFTINMAVVFSHLLRPRIDPLPGGARAQTNA